MNRKFIFYNNYIVNLFTLIGFRPSHKKRLYSNPLSRVKKRRILFILQNSCIYPIDYY